MLPKPQCCREYIHSCTLVCHVALCFSFYLGSTHTVLQALPEKGHLSYPSVTCNVRNRCHNILPAKHRSADTDTKDDSIVGKKSEKKDKHEGCVSSTDAASGQQLQNTQNRCPAMQHPHKALQLTTMALDSSCLQSLILMQTAF